MYHGNHFATGLIVKPIKLTKKFFKIDDLNDMTLALQ